MKRILVTLAGQGSIASVIRTGLLDNMRISCEPVIGILWDQPDLCKELQEKGYEVHLIPDIRLSDTYILNRQKINFAFLRFVLKSSSTEIEQRYKRYFLSLRKRCNQFLVNNILYWKFKLNPHLLDKLKANEKILIRNEPCYKAFFEWIEKVNIHGIYSATPFLIQAEIIARILKEKGGITLAAIHSFDNVTKRPWSAIHFDAYSVWNVYNKKELLRIYPELSEKHVYINGAPQFDFHFDPAFLISREEWKAMLGIKSDRKIILYAGGWKGATPYEDQYIKNIIEGIRSGAIEDNPILVLRGHPLDTLDRWKEVRTLYPEIVMDVVKQGDKKFDYSNLTITDIKRFCSTLHYTDVHVNLVSTMAIDGAAHNKPQIAPYYDTIKAEKELRSLYYQEHYVPVVRSGALSMAKSPAFLQKLINGALQKPEKFTAANDHLLREIITYTDGQSSQRVTNFLEKYFSP